MAKSVLLAQLSEEESLIWHNTLSSHNIEVWAAPDSENLLKLLEQKQQSQQSLPSLIISDIGIRYGGGTSLLATELCKWCTENAPETKVLLINPRQTQIKEVEKRWATRRGAVDLLPKTSLDNLAIAFETAAKSLDIVINEESLTLVVNGFKQQQNQLDRGAIKGRNIRQTATQELARKMAMIPLMIMATEAEPTDSDKVAADDPRQNLALDSTISQLHLYDVTIELDKTGAFAKELFKSDPLLPALLISDQGKYVGMLSRRRFLECLSRPYALELFTKRPLRVMYEQINGEPLKLVGSMSIVMAAQLALSRGSDDIYEPLVVQLGDEQYRVLDVHDLLQSQSYIHELATKLLREQTQSSMIQTEKMASLGQIVAEVSHDIRNPVSAIYGNTECLLTYIEGVMQILRAYEKEYGTISPLVVETLENVDWEFVRSDLPQVVRSIQSGAKYLRRLVDTLQSLSHMEDHASPEPIDLLDCVDSSLTILSGRIRNVQIVKSYTKIPSVNGYSDRLIQVFMNLISNALDALMDMQARPELVEQQRSHMLVAEDGKERTATQTLTHWQPIVVIHSAIVELDNRNWLSIKISDNGVGIPKEIQNRIFDNFFTTKGQGKGTGLGLAICHQIITQQHNGKIILRSPYLNSNGDVTIGTEFEVLLPCT
jgi:signal transduction histidine kinase